MSKKLVYGLFFVILLSISFVSPAVAATTYKFPMAEGTGEKEVKIYDEDTWKELVSDDLDSPKYLFDGTLMKLEPFVELRCHSRAVAKKQGMDLHAGDWVLGDAELGEQLTAAGLPVWAERYAALVAEEAEL